jgi:Uma2 family endonuclease
MSSVVERKMTAADLERMPKDGFRYELVDGEIRKFMPPGFEHGDIAMRISARLAVYVYDNALGSVTAAETGFKIDEFNVRAPDGAFVSNERLQKYGRPAGFFPSAPDLAIEVVSLGDTKREAKEKTEWWLKSGARLVWVVDAKRRKVTAHHANGNIFEYGIDDMLDGQDVVPGFKLAVKEVFK